MSSTKPASNQQASKLSELHADTSSFRIVSLCPSNTELIFALGLDSYLVGVDNYSDYPADALTGLPRLGPDLHIDIDAVVELKPNLVVSSLSVPGMEQVVDGIAVAGLRQIALSPHNLNEIYQDLRTLADAVPESILPPHAAEKVITDLQSRVQRIVTWVEENVSPSQRQRLYWEWWPNPVFSPGERNWLTEISHLAGAENIFAGEVGDSVQDDGTKVCAANPDWFLAVWTGVPQHKVPLQKIRNRDQPWHNTSAFQKKQLLILSEGLFCRPSPRLVDGLEQLVGLLYPQAIQELGLCSPQDYAPVRLVDGSWLGES